MSKLPRTTLPAINNELHAAFPAHIRSTPNGGRAWICADLTCQQYASQELAQGLFVCQRHAETIRRHFQHHADTTKDVVVYTADGVKYTGAAARRLNEAHRTQMLYRFGRPRGVTVAPVAASMATQLEEQVQAVEVPGVPNAATAQPPKVRRAQQVRAWAAKIKNVLGQPVRRFKTGSRA